MSPDKTIISTIPIRPPTKDDVVAEARKWINTKWVHQGRSKVGIDCAGLLIRVGNALGLDVRDMQGYKRSPEGHRFLEHIRGQTDLVRVPEPGCIAVFRQSYFPCHVGIFTELHGTLHFVHSYMNLGKVMEEQFAHDWPRLLVETRTYRGLAD